MGNQWTEEQKEVIRHRGSNLLVSAAAGSGKTAVLVERILGLIMDPDHPTDVDRLLVVTFTRAAAGEMKQRLMDQLEARLNESLAEEGAGADGGTSGRLDDRMTEHLQKQTVLLNHAEITTIDGFCTYVIQNYFQRIDLDPGYRIAEEGELKLLRSDVIAQLLEDRYENATQDFLNFMDAYASGKDDGKAETLIERIYQFAMSHPDPEEWLLGCQANGQVEDDESLSGLGWMQDIFRDTRLRLDEAQREAEKLVREAEETGSEDHINILRNDLKIIRTIAASQTYGDYQKALAQAGAKAGSEGAYQTWKALRGAKKLEELGPANVEKLNSIKERRSANKDKVVKKLKKEYYSYDEEAILSDLHALKPYMNELIRLVLEFAERFAEAKRKKNIADFSDLEHFAYRILVTRDEQGNLVRTEAAKELAEQFDEVMIDEYQDSNLLQEVILSAVAKGGNGEDDGEGLYNRFMVGDMKQSIYGFRMARPELFLEKFNRYHKGLDHGSRIDLSKNFRSRQEVLAATNTLFQRIMVPELGGIRYDETQALYLGATDYEKTEDPGQNISELLIISQDDPNLDGAGSKMTRIQYEAQACANRIKELMANQKIYDRKAKAFRPMRYSDCVILLRVTADWADIFVKTLQANNIPAFATSKSGYFSTLEVQTVLNYLSICDNPQQDIPLTAVLKSPMVGLSDQELADIRIANPEIPFYQAVAKYPESEDADLYEKLQNFLTELAGMRQRSTWTPVHQLIHDILTETGYGAYAAAMPSGEQRQANLRMLVEKAIEYENTSYHGVFNFIRYIEKLKQYQVDYGEVNIFGEKDDVVRVMSIHMSKGLQFPVVFVSGLGKQFNKMDESNAVVMHADLGIGMKYVDLEGRVSKTTILREAIRSKIDRDSLGEELRVLYVAMTRAEEKLILTGFVKKAEEIETLISDQYEQTSLKSQETEDRPYIPRQVEYGDLIKAKSYMDWIKKGVMDASVLKIRAISAESLAIPVLTENLMLAAKVRELAEPEPAAVRLFTASESRRRFRNFLEERKNFVYPYLMASLLPAKLTVSDIKHAAIEDQREEKGQDMFPTQEAVPCLPEFVRGSQEESEGGAARGTVYHHFLQCLNYAAVPTLTGDEDADEQLSKVVEAEIGRMKSQGILAPKDADCIRVRDMVVFLQGPLGRRMKTAADAGCLFREQPFVMDVSAKDIDKSWLEEENILVQGTIDAYFSEEGKYVIVDYKTDRIFSRDGQDLVRKYAKQLQYYKKALSRITGIEVAEMWLYSVTLGKGLKVPDES